MKKLIAFILVLTSLLCLCACGGGSDKNDEAENILLSKYLREQSYTNGSVTITFDKYTYSCGDTVGSWAIFSGKLFLHEGDSSKGEIKARAIFSYDAPDLTLDSETEVSFLKKCRAGEKFERKEDRTPTLNKLVDCKFKASEEAIENYKIGILSIRFGENGEHYPFTPFSSTLLSSATWEIDGEDVVIKETFGGNYREYRFEYCDSTLTLKEGQESYYRLPAGEKLQREIDTEAEQNKIQEKMYTHYSTETSVCMYFHEDGKFAYSPMSFSSDLYGEWEIDEEGFVKVKTEATSGAGEREYRFKYYDGALILEDTKYLGGFLGLSGGEVFEST